MSALSDRNQALANTEAPAKERIRATVRSTRISDNLTAVIQVRGRPVPRFMRPKTFVVTTIPMKTLSRADGKRNLMTTILRFALLVTTNRYQAIRYGSSSYFSAVNSRINAPRGGAWLCVCPPNITSIVVAVVIVLHVIKVTPTRGIVMRNMVFRPGRSFPRQDLDTPSSRYS